MTEPRRVDIGPATLWCGDANALREAGAFRDADALLTDPPYGLGQVFNCGRRNTSVRGEAYIGTIVGDDVRFDPVPWIELMRLPARNESTNSRVQDYRPVMFFGADHFCQSLPAGGRFVCWDKSCGMGPAAVYMDAEFCWTNRRNPRSIVRHFWMGAMRAGDPVLNSRARRLHVSQKPVEVLAWCLDHMRVGLGKTVLDPFMGSGSTGVACLVTGRRFIGCEIDERIFETAVARIADVWARIEARNLPVSADGRCDG